MYPNEKVMVVKDELIGYKKGIINVMGIGMLKGFFVMLKEAEFLDRQEVETNGDYRQIIPQIVVCCDHGDEEKYLVMTRLKTQGEERLHGKSSITVGGHINDTDIDSSNALATFQNAMLRELNEELVMQEDYDDIILDLYMTYLINSVDNPVDEVHFGVVMVYTTIPDVRPEIRETDKMTGRWLTPDEIVQEIKDGVEYESWSVKIVGEIVEDLMKEMECR